MPIAKSYQNIYRFLETREITGKTARQHIVAFSLYKLRELLTSLDLETLDAAIICWKECYNNAFDKRIATLHEISKLCKRSYLRDRYVRDQYVLGKSISPNLREIYQKLYTQYTKSPVQFSEEIESLIKDKGDDFRKRLTEFHAMNAIACDLRTARLTVVHKLYTELLSTYEKDQEDDYIECLRLLNPLIKFMVEKKYYSPLLHFADDVSIVAIQLSGIIRTSLLQEYEYTPLITKNDAENLIAHIHSTLETLQEQKESSYTELPIYWMLYADFLTGRTGSLEILSATAIGLKVKAHHLLRTLENTLKLGENIFFNHLKIRNAVYFQGEKNMPVPPLLTLEQCKIRLSLYASCGYPVDLSDGTVYLPVDYYDMTTFFPMLNVLGGAFVNAHLDENAFLEIFFDSKNSETQYDKLAPVLIQTADLIWIFNEIARINTGKISTTEFKLLTAWNLEIFCPQNTSLSAVNSFDVIEELQEKIAEDFPEQINLFQPLFTQMNKFKKDYKDYNVPIPHEELEKTRMILEKMRKGISPLTAPRMSPS